MFHRRLPLIALACLLFTSAPASAADDFVWPPKLEKKAKSLARKAKKQGDAYALREDGYTVIAPSKEVAGHVSLYLQLFEEDFLDLFKTKRRIASAPEVTVLANGGDETKFEYEVKLKDDPDAGRSRFDITNRMIISMKNDGDPTFADLDQAALHREATRMMLTYVLGNSSTKAAWLETAVVAWFETWDIRDDVKTGVDARRKRAKPPQALIDSAEKNPPTMQDLVQPATRSKRGKPGRLGETFVDTLLTVKKAKSTREKLLDEIAGLMAADKPVGNPLSKGQTRKIEALWLAHLLEGYAPKGGRG